MKLSSVRIDNMSFRFDAEYFRKEWVIYSELLKKNSVRLGNLLLDGRYGILPDSADYVNEGLPLIRGVDIRKDGINLDNLIKVPHKYYQEKYSIRIDDILILVKGATIGYQDGVQIINEHLGDVIFNGSVFRIRTKNILPNYLFAFMSSKYFVFQKILAVANNGIEYNAIASIKNFLIPIFPLQFQQSIETLVKLSHEKLSYSQQLYKEAELILNTELGLIDFNPENHNISIVKLSDSLQKTGRLDAEYYQPKYNSIIAYIKTKAYAKLGTIVNTKKSIEPGSDIYCDAGIEFIRVSNITKFGITKTDIHLPLNFLPETELNTLKPKQDTILLSKDGTIGIAYTVKDDTECITSGALLHLSIKDAYINDILPEYLTLVLNSTLVQLQAEQDSGGSIIKHWKPSEIATVLIPLLPITIQTTISDKIKHSFQLRQESTALLEQAKHAVEMMIEG